MTIKTTLFFLLIISSLYSLEDLGTHGATQSIKEENFMSKVQRHSKDLNSSLIQEQFYSSQKEFLQVEKLVPTCTESKKRSFTPTFIVPADIVLPNGEIIARAGEEKKTLEIMRKNNMSINKYVMFIDAEDLVQTELSYRYKNQGDVFITNGSIEEYEKTFQTNAYKADFLSIERFNIKCSPSITIQQGDELVIYEYKPDDLIQRTENGVKK